MTMSSSSVDGEEEGQRKVNVLTSSSSSPSIDGVCDLRERNYMGLSDCSSVGSSALSPSLEDVNLSLNLKATELRLGLPGSTSPERDHELCLLMSPRRDEKPLLPLFSPKSVGSGSKRGFSDTVDSFVEGTLGSNPEPLSIQESSCVANKAKQNLTNAASNINTAPTPNRTQVVGWPPIRSSFRKNSAATIPSKKSNEEVERKAGDRALFVKVSMDGAPYLRKVDLSAYSVYQQLSSALEKMFSCFTIGQYGSHGNEKLSETKLKDLLHGSEYVLTYEDKDGDWMLVGDVPWEMFISTCKRLRIMKGCDAIGLAPRAVCGPKL